MANEREQQICGRPAGRPISDRRVIHHRVGACAQLRPARARTHAHTHLFAGVTCSSIGWATKSMRIELKCNCARGRARTTCPRDGAARATLGDACSRACAKLFFTSTTTTTTATRTRWWSVQVHDATRAHQISATRSDFKRLQQQQQQQQEQQVAKRSRESQEFAAATKASAFEAIRAHARTHTRKRQSLQKEFAHTGKLLLCRCDERM